MDVAEYMSGLVEGILVCGGGYRPPSPPPPPPPRYYTETLTCDRCRSKVQIEFDRQCRYNGLAHCPVCGLVFPKTFPHCIVRTTVVEKGSLPWPISPSPEQQPTLSSFTSLTPSSEGTGKIVAQAATWGVVAIIGVLLIVAIISKRR